MIDLTTFEPDPDRARWLDARMQKGLCDSLAHIRDSARDAGAFDVSLLNSVIDGLDDAVAYPPAAFGWYYELAFAIFDEDRAGMTRAAHMLSRMQPASDGFSVLAFDDKRLDEDRDMYSRRIGDMGGSRMLAPKAGDVASFADRLEKALALIARVSPELLGEIEVLVKELILASGKDSDKIQFDGASAYQLWGALFINPKFGETPLVLAETLAHETAHSLLFGFTFDEPLVFNLDDELYPSPLRQDPRPMDGIYHATFVSARMHWAMRKIAGDSGFDSALRDEADKAALADIANFKAGYKVIADHGKLSDTGRALMNTARAYMAGAA